MKKKNSINNGQISVFLSLILFLVLALVCTMIEGARIQASKAFILNIMDMGMDSLLAEYNRELLEQYDLFFIDGGYGGKEFSVESIEERIFDYMEYNYKPDRGNPGIKNVDLWKTEIEKVQVSQVRRATDHSGYILKEQAVDYMKNKTGLDIIEESFDLLKYFEGNKDLEELFIEEERRNQEDRETFGKIQPETDEMENNDDQKIENPLDDIDKLKQVSILNLVIENPETISNNEIAPEGLVSLRELPDAGAPLYKKEDISEKLVEIIFGEYILEKFSSYTDPDFEGELEYETEYILFGKESDYKNLEEAAEKLMLMREGINFTYLLTDTEKKQEAYSVAVLLTGFTGIPALITATQIGLLLGWAFAESAVDVKNLLSGKKVPLFKTKGTWQTSLKNMGKLKEKTDGNKESEEIGISYKDYLRILLFLKEPKEKVMRVMDLIEKDVKKKSLNFKMQNAIESICFVGYWRINSLFLSLPFMKEIKYQEEGYSFSLEIEGNY